MLAFRGCVKQMTHKSGVKAGSEGLVPECCVIVCSAFSALDPWPVECDCPWEFPSADAEEPVTNESELSCCLSVTKFNDDDEQGFSTVGATASDDDFWRDGDLGMSVILDKFMAGSEDNLLKRGNKKKLILNFCTLPLASTGKKLNFVHFVQADWNLSSPLWYLKYSQLSLSRYTLKKVSVTRAVCLWESFP